MRNEILSRTQDYLDIVGVIIIVIRPDQTVELINRKGCEVLGYEKAEIEGQNWFDKFVPGEDKEETRLYFMQMLQSDNEPVEYYENAILTKNGDIKYVQWHNAYLRNEQGEIIAMLSSGEDVTFKKVLQSRLAAHEKEKRIQILAAVLEAQENERYEIAYELHDNVSQILTTCKILLENEIKDAHPSVFVANSYRYLQNAIDEIRNISHRLNPAQLEDMGLYDSVKDLIRGMNMAGRFNVKFEVNNPAALKYLYYHLSLSIFRIIQEQLTNIVKHADANSVSIIIEVSEKFIDVEVADDGKGFDLKKVVKGLGLKNIRNRAEFHRGRSYIGTSVGEGCTLSVCLPLSEQAT